METYQILSCLLLLFDMKAGINACNLQTCLEWRISVDELNLICKINNLHLLVLIDDPSGSTRADCYPDTEHTTCESYYENESITQNMTTKEIVYTVHGKIDHRLNGKWSCRHGTRLNVATVEVTVLERCSSEVIDKTGKRRKNITNVESCTKYSFIWTIIAYFSSMMICIVLLSTSLRFHNMNVWKKIILILLTVVFFLIVDLMDFTVKEGCQLKFLSVVLGSVFGIITSALLWNRKDEQAVGE